MPIDDTKLFTINVNGPQTKMKKWSVIYGSRLSNATEATLRYLAQHFDLIDCNPYSTGQPHNHEKLALLKQYAAQDYNNQSIKGIGYYYWLSSNIATFPEDWYVHYDGYVDSTHRVYEGGSTTQAFMQPKAGLTPYQGYTGWREYYTGACYNGLMDEVHGLMYDGVFNDNVYWTLSRIDGDFSTLIPTSRWTDETGAPITQAQWGAGVYDSFVYQQSILDTVSNGRNISMMNCGSMGVQMSPATNWACYEHWIHSLRSSYLNYWGGTEGSALWGVSHVNNVHLMQSNGAYTGLLSGCAQDAGYNDWLLYCYCCGLLACVDLEHTYYAWNFYGDDVNNGWIQYPMDVQVGQPITSWGTATDIRNTPMYIHEHTWDPYGFQYHGGVFAREFENYWVVVNFAGAIQGQPVDPQLTWTWTDPNEGTHIIGGKKALLWQKT